MDTAIKRNYLENKVITAISVFRIENIEKILSNLLESVPNNSPVNYIGELNKSDVMH